MEKMEHLFNMKMNEELRPWGIFKVISDTELYKAKILTIFRDQSISLQYHNHRSEIWYVVSGKGSYVNCLLDKEYLTCEYSSGDIIEIPQGNVHKISADTETVIFEVQIGTSFDESDIIRLEDKYGRIKKE